METQRFVIPYGHWKRQVLVGFPVIIFFAVLVGWMTDTKVWPFYFFIGLLALGFSLFGETVIDSPRSRVIRRWSLLKVIPVKHKLYPLSNFSSIGTRFQDDAEDNRTWYVYLSIKEGGRLDVRWFGYSKQLPPEAFQLETKLAEATGLPIKNQNRSVS